MRLGLLLLPGGLRLRRRAERDVDLRQHVGKTGLRLAVQFRVGIGGDELLASATQLPHPLLLLLRFKVARLQNQRLRAFGEAGQLAQQPVAELRGMNSEQEAGRLPERMDGLRCQWGEGGRNGGRRLPLHER